MKATEALYLHLPFCDHICYYCDFAKVLSSTADHSLYVDQLIEEMESLAIREDSLKTIYLGGGTPSATKKEPLEKLLSYLHSHFPSVEEFSMEANPESLTEEKIALLEKYGVNRVSLGVQSASEKNLKLLGRKHTIEDVRRAVFLLRKHGIENINLDFIYGLPNMSILDVDDDIDFAFSLRPKHLSFYSLQIEDGTLFGVRKVKAEDDSLLAEQYEHIVTRLAERGYRRYEVSNFALEGYECKHNLTYWHDETYYACGIGASGYLKDTRYTDTRSLTHYLAGQYNRTEEKIDRESEKTEFLMLNLRLNNGFSLSNYFDRFREDFVSVYQNRLTRLAPYIDLSSDRMAIKPEYLYTMDSILLELL